MQKSVIFATGISNTSYADDRNAETYDKHLQRDLYELRCRFGSCCLLFLVNTYLQRMRIPDNLRRHGVAEIYGKK